VTAALYPCQITHARGHPIRRVFRYRGYLWLADLDDLPPVPLPLRPFARFQARDHLGGADGSLRASVDTYLGRHGISLAGGRVLMLGHARVLGYVFNMGGQPPPPGAIAGLGPGHHVPAPPPAPARHPRRLPRAAASRRGDPAQPYPGDHLPAIPARRPHGRPDRGDRAAVGTGILTRLAAGIGPHRLHTPTAGTVPPTAAHDHVTG
jgi:hypothetical protein